MTTLREHLEAIRKRNSGWTNEECRDDYRDAVAALAILDAARIHYPRATLRPTSGTYRLVPDTEPTA